MENGFITVYHGTHDKFVGDIKKSGLKAGNMGYDNSVWYMVSTDMDSALYHSTPGGDTAYVFEFEIPVNNSKWEGYPYFWPPYNRKLGSKWFALKQELPPKFIKKIHKVKKDKYTDSKNNGLNEEVIQETHVAQKDLEKLTYDTLVLMSNRCVQVYDSHTNTQNLREIPPIYIDKINVNEYNELQDFIDDAVILVNPVFDISNSGGGKLKYSPKKGGRDEYFEINLNYSFKHVERINEALDGNKYDRNGRVMSVYMEISPFFHSVLLHELQHAYDAWRSKGKAFNSQSSVDYINKKKASRKLEGKPKSELTPEEIEALKDSHKAYLNLVHEINARFTQAINETWFTSLDANRNDRMEPWSRVFSMFKRVFLGWDILSEKMKKKLTRRLAKAYQHESENLVVRREVNENKVIEIRRMIRKVILESIEIDDIDNKTKLEVFDFDGTLVNTPTPTEDNKDIWKNKTGKNWEGGWFGNEDSLNMDVFDMPVIPSVISDYNKSDADPSILKVMLTGRIKKMDKYVRAVLDSKGLKFDDYLYNEGGDTEKEKIRHMEAILKYNPNIREVIVHDDRDPHIPIFQAWGNSMIDKGHLDAFSINHIPGFRHL